MNYQYHNRVPVLGAERVPFQPACGTTGAYALVGTVLDGGVDTFQLDLITGFAHCHDNMLDAVDNVTGKLRFVFNAGQNDVTVTATSLRDTDLMTDCWCADTLGRTEDCCEDSTPCIHEHACVRCSMLRPDPNQRHRLVDIRDNLLDRIARPSAKAGSAKSKAYESAWPEPRPSSPRSTNAHNKRHRSHSAPPEPKPNNQ